MTDDRMARPFSGEIMSGDRSDAGQRPTPREDVIDAEFVTIGPEGARQTGQAARPEGRPGQQSAAPGMDILKGRADRSHRPDRGGPLFWIGGLFMVAAAFWVSGGHALLMRPQVVTHEAQRAPAAALRITDVESRLEPQGSRMFLLIDGAVVNDGASRAPLSGLDITVAGKDGLTTRYFLGTSGRAIEPGGRFAFSSRLEAPKDGVETVTVDFRKEGDN